MPPPKDYVKLVYPRKCEQCDYISNNPSMYHYHKKTHEAIPEGTLCSHGCGQAAKFCGTGGKYTCSSVAQHCPTYILNHSRRVKEQWERPEASKRKEETKQSLIQRLHNQETVNKMKASKRKKTNLLTPDRVKNYRHYARRIREQAQRWAKEQGYELGQQTWHVDHKLSIIDAWNYKLPMEIVNHPANLQVIEAKKNSSKGCKSSITLDELLRRIDEKV
jgi:hypothetical protein